jgi:hypothetical protein
MTDFWCSQGYRESYRSSDNEKFFRFCCSKRPLNTIYPEAVILARRNWINLMTIIDKKLALKTIVEALKSSPSIDPDGASFGLKPGQFTTTQAIKMRNGFYLAEPVSVRDSTNADLGRDLSCLSEMLCIRKVNSVKTFDDRGHPSTTAVWEHSEAEAEA